MSGRDRPEPEASLDPRLREAFRQIDESLASLPRIEPAPGFEARFRARLARAEEPGTGLAWLRRLGQLAWPVPAGALAVLALLLTLENPSLPEQDWRLVEDAESFELVLADPEMLAVLSLLESEDAVEKL